MLAPLTDLGSECGETKANKHTGTKKSPFWWDESHKKAFDNEKIWSDTTSFWPIQIICNCLVFILTCQLGI